MPYGGDARNQETTAKSARRMPLGRQYDYGHSPPRVSAWVENPLAYSYCSVIMVITVILQIRLMSVQPASVWNMVLVRQIFQEARKYSLRPAIYLVLVIG